MVAYGIISGGILIKEGLPDLRNVNRWIAILIVGYLFVFLHILAVRSGLVVFYLSTVILSAIYALRQRSFKTLIITLVLAIVLPVVGFLTIPSLNKRIHYMIYDLNEFRKNGGDRYSDSDRIFSLMVGWDIFTDHPAIGTGIGDLKDTCNRKYLDKFGPKKYVLYPHNQYLFIMAGMGIIGLAAFLIFLWGPLIVENNHNNLFLLAIVLIFSIGFLFDNALERSFSAGLYAFLISVGIRSRHHNVIT